MVLTLTPLTPGPATTSTGTTAGKAHSKPKLERFIDKTNEFNPNKTVQSYSLHF